MHLPQYTGTPRAADRRLHDGGLRPAVGVHNFQVMRANHTYPHWAEGCGYTYNHAPMLCYWQGRFWLQFLSAPRHEHQAPCHTLLVSSADGRTWSRPQVIFPVFTLPDGSLPIAHQRMGFYGAQDGRLLVLGFYGKAPTPNDGHGIGRLVRELYADGSYGPLYFIRYNPGYGAENTPYPPFTASPDAGFRRACEELLAHKLMVQQWAEEDKFATDDFYVLRPDEHFHAKAFSWYTLADGRVVGLWKDHFFTVAERWEHGLVPQPQQVESFVYGWGKGWGQRTADGRYALVYNPLGGKPELRYPLAVTTSADGLHFDQDLLAVHGEVPPPRFYGLYKDTGPQYVRGVEEGNPQPPDGALWLAYSVNKEDIWVSRVPVPIQAIVDVHRQDDFSQSLPGGVLPGWNLYSPLWAPVTVVEEAGMSFLRLRDRDPYEYAKAVRVFPESRQVRIDLQVRAQQAGQDDLALEVVSGQGQRPIRFVVSAAAERLWVQGTTGASEIAAPLGAWVRLALLIDTDQGCYDLWVADELVARALPFAEPATTVERLEFRTGAYRREDMRRIPHAGAYLTTDLPHADEPVAEAIFDVGAVTTAALTAR
jgi:hypothetical protein